MYAMRNTCTTYNSKGVYLKIIINNVWETEKLYLSYKLSNSALISLNCYVLKHFKTKSLIIFD